MNTSVFDIYTIGVGPSSSHTVGPMRAARRFVSVLGERGVLDRTARVSVELFGSLGATGKGHHSDLAIMMGLEGETPEGVPIDSIRPRCRQIAETHRIRLYGTREVAFDPQSDLVFHRNTTLPQHSNGMKFCALDDAGSTLHAATYYSVGGGFVADLDAEGNLVVRKDRRPVPYPFLSCAELLERCHAQNFTIAELVLENEKSRRSAAEISDGLQRIWSAMRECVQRGIATEGELPGAMRVRRRAPKLYRLLTEGSQASARDPAAVLDWVSMYALAVNEENAAGGRVVTAPTNGAAGIMPAVLHYYTQFCNSSPAGIETFLLTAGGICNLYIQNASISGAEMGCQGEVGVACSMAAAGLTAGLGGSNEQVENAAEIGMEHNLGLTCDPVGGLVQIPCIERNAMGAIKAINASRLAMHGDGTHKVSLDKVIATMSQTGRDMASQYKETSRGGLAVNVIEC